MVLHRERGAEHRDFINLTDYILPGDMILLNDTKVIPARLSGTRENGASLDILLSEKIDERRYKILSKGKYSGKALFAEGVKAEIISGTEARFNCKGDFNAILQRIGAMPVPPYIKRPPEEADRKWYQTIFAAKEGSIAAPTAGLHFTSEIIREIESKDVLIKTITLHVGTGTFRPVRAKEIEHHKMDEEFFEIETDVLKRIREVKHKGGRLFVTGTTSARAIEACFSNRFKPLTGSNGKVRGTTDIFIYPGYVFKAADALITNFHLPASTPVMLTSAFAGRERLLKAYKEAVKEEYRFFSYGDAMLIL